MARQLRVQYPGAIYHVMNRGDRRRPIFKDEPGGVEMKEQLLEQMGRGVGGHHGGEAKRETVEQKAESIVVAELRKRRWTEGELANRRKTDAAKVKIARRLRGETVMTLDWIAQRLQMGCRHTLANCLKPVQN